MVVAVAIVVVAVSVAGRSFWQDGIEVSHGCRSSDVSQCSWKSQEMLKCETDPCVLHVVLTRTGKWYNYSACPLSTEMRRCGVHGPADGSVTKKFNDGFGYRTFCLDYKQQQRPGALTVDLWQTDIVLQQSHMFRSQGAGRGRTRPSLS